MHGWDISDSKSLAHLLLNKVHDVFEVQVIIVVLDSSSNVVVQKVDGLFKEKNDKRGPHIPQRPTQDSPEVPTGTECPRAWEAPTPARTEYPLTPTLNTLDRPAHTRSLRL